MNTAIDIERAMERELHDEIRRLYRAGWSIHRIAPLAGMSPFTVRRRLMAMGVTLRKRYWRADRCVDCGRETGGHRRCRYHEQVRHAELQKDYWERLA